MGELDDAYKSLMFPRVYDEEYPIRDRDQE